MLTITLRVDQNTEDKENIDNSEHKLRRLIIKNFEYWALIALKNIAKIIEYP